MAAETAECPLMSAYPGARMRDMLKKATDTCLARRQACERCFPDVVYMTTSIIQLLGRYSPIHE